MQTKSLRYRACLSTGLTVIYIDLSAAFICCAFDVRLVGVIFASSYGDLVSVYLFTVSIMLLSQPLDLEFLQPVYPMDDNLICKVMQTITNQGSASYLRA